MTSPVQTVGYAGWVYGTGPSLGDPAEDLHEASRLYPGVVDPDVTGGALLQRSPDMRASAGRSVLRRTGLPAVELPAGRPLARLLDDVLRARRSNRRYGDAPISLDELAALLRASYGVQILYYFINSIMPTILGALITFADAPLYPTYELAPRILGISALQDQQIGALIMWVPGGTIFLVALTVSFFRWMNREDDEAGSAVAA